MSISEGTTIAYLDDDEYNVILFEASFGKHFNVISFTSPVKALEGIEQHAADLKIVVSDMKMPDMNGVDFIRKVRAKYDHLTFYILTGYAFDPIIDEALSNGEIAASFLKPFDRYKLIVEFQSRI